MTLAGHGVDVLRIDEPKLVTIEDQNRLAVDLLYPADEQLGPSTRVASRD